MINKNADTSCNPPTSALELTKLLRYFNEPIRYFGERDVERRERCRTIMQERLTAGKPIRRPNKRDDSKHNQTVNLRGPRSLLHFRKNLITKWVSMGESFLKHIENQELVDPKSLSFDYTKIQSKPEDYLEEVQEYLQLEPIKNEVLSNLLNLNRKGKHNPSSSTRLAGVLTLDVSQKRVTDIGLHKGVPIVSTFDGKILLRPWNEESPSVTILKNTCPMTAQCIVAPNIIVGGNQLGELRFGQIPNLESLYIDSKLIVDSMMTEICCGDQRDLTTSEQIANSYLDSFHYSNINLNESLNFEALDGIVLNSHSSKVSNIKKLPLLNSIVSGGRDGFGVIWDMENPTSALQKLYSEGSGITALEVHPHSNIVHIGDLDGRLRTWDLRVGRAVNVRFPHSSHVSSIMWHPEQLVYYYSAGGDNTLKLWDARMYHSNIPVRESLNHSDLITEIKWAEKINSLITCSLDKSVMIINCDSLEACSSAFAAAHSFIGIDVYDNFVAAADTGGNVRLLHTESM